MNTHVDQGVHAAMLKLVGSLLVSSLFMGCVSANRWIEIHVRDTDQIDVKARDDAKIVRTKTDITVNTQSVMADGSWAGRAPPTIVQLVGTDAPDELVLKDDKYEWKRSLNAGAVTSSTTRDNIKNAEVATMYTQPMGILPSLAFGALGTFCAIGFGVAGPALIVEGVNEPNDGKVGEGVGLSIAAVVSAAVATYGVVTFFMVDGPPDRDPLPIAE